MAKQIIDIHISQVINHLANGMTWLADEDEGFGSIEEIYGAKPSDIAAIRQHPKLIGLEPTFVVFNVIDDTLKEGQPLVQQVISLIDDTIAGEPVIGDPQLIEQTPAHFSNLL